MNDLEMAAKFHEAARYLRVYGLLRGRRGEHGGPRCAAGAVLSVAGEAEARPLILAASSRIEPAYDVFEALIHGRKLYPLAEWSDTQCDKEIVAQFFDGFAHDLELRHQITSTPTASSQEAILPTLKEAVPA